MVVPVKLRATSKLISGSNSGLTLMEVLVSLGLSGLIIGVMLTASNDLLRMLRDVQTRSEMQELRTQLARTVDCSKTLGPFQNSLGAIAAGTALPLRNRRNDLLGSTDGSGVFAGARHLMGDWYGRASWDGTAIQIRTAKANGSGSDFAPDPGQDGQLLNFSSHYSELYGYNSEVRLCAQSARINPTSLYAGRTVGEAETRHGGGTLAPAGCPDVLFTKAALGNVFCVELCADRNFTSGWLSECMAAIPQYDANGNYTGAIPLQPAQQVMGCRCVR